MKNKWKGSRRPGSTGPCWFPSPSPAPSPVTSPELSKSTLRAGRCDWPLFLNAFPASPITQPTLRTSTVPRCPTCSHHTRWRHRHARRSDRDRERAGGHGWDRDCDAASGDGNGGRRLLLPGELFSHPRPSMFAGGGPVPVVCLRCSL